MTDGERKSRVQPCPVLPSIDSDLTGQVYRWQENYCAPESPVKNLDIKTRIVPGCTSFPSPPGTRRE